MYVINIVKKDFTTPENLQSRNHFSYIFFSSCNKVIYQECARIESQSHNFTSWYPASQASVNHAMSHSAKLSSEFLKILRLFLKFIFQIEKQTGILYSSCDKKLKSL